jgi:hypothetical protein
MIQIDSSLSLLHIHVSYTARRSLFASTPPIPGTHSINPEFHSYVDLVAIKHVSEPEFYAQTNTTLSPPRPPPAHSVYIAHFRLSVSPSPSCVCVNRCWVCVMWEGPTHPEIRSNLLVS